MKDMNTILVMPIITEKATAMNPEKDKKKAKKYSFRVAVDSNKIEVKNAVEKLYKVKVDKVNMIVMNPKWKRVRSNYGYTDIWKKAIVTLKEGDIDIFKV